MAGPRRNVGACCHTAGMTNDVKASRKRFAELCEQQYHVISRRQALEHGFNASKLRHRLRPGGPWQKILPGVYATTTGTVTSDQRQMAALQCGIAKMSLRAAGPLGVEGTLLDWPDAQAH